MKGATSTCTLTQARALLSNDPDLCRELGVLPRGYHGDDCDREEFFTPADVLAQVEQIPDWGLFRDPHGYDRRILTLVAISEIIQEYRHAFDPQVHLSGRMRLRVMVACREELRLLLTELEALTVVPVGGAA